MSNLCKRNTRNLPHHFTYATFWGTIDVQESVCCKLAAMVFVKFKSKYNVICKIGTIYSF
jgi:hypothetical protein